jgi:hypothetical protein
MSEPQPFADLIEALKSRGPNPGVTDSVSQQAARVIQDLLARVPQHDQCVVRKAATLDAAEACTIVSDLRESQAMEASEDLPNAGLVWRKLAIELQAAAKR